MFDLSEAWRNVSSSETTGGKACLSVVFAMRFELAGMWRGIGSEWPPADQHHLTFYWPAFQLQKSMQDSNVYLGRITAAQDESLQLSLHRKHCKNYCYYFIDLGSQRLRELSKATQRASGKAGSTLWAHFAHRGSSQTTPCLKGHHSTDLWLVYMFKWKTNCSIFVFICTSNICPGF